MTARAALGRAQLPGYEMTSPSGFGLLCVTTTSAGQRGGDGAAAARFFASGTTADYPVIDLMVVPFDTVAAATTRMSAEEATASGSGRVQSPDPTFMPTVVTGHAAMSTGAGGVQVS